MRCIKMVMHPSISQRMLKIALSLAVLPDIRLLFIFQTQNSEEEKLLLHSLGVSSVVLAWRDSQ